MLSSRSWRIAVWAALLVVAVGRTCAAQPGGDSRFIVTDTDAILVMPPELVAAPSVDEAFWSADGEYVLASQTYARLTSDMLQAALKSGGGPSGSPQGETGLVLWTRKTGQTRVLWRQSLANGSVSGVRWLPGSSVAVAQTMRDLPRSSASPEVQRVRCVLRIHAPTGLARVVVEAPEPGDVRTYVSPSAALAFVHRITVAVPEGPGGGPAPTAVRDETLVPLSPAGAGAPLRLPGGCMMFAVDWAQDGRAILRCQLLTAAPGAAKEVVYLLDVRKGTIEPAPGPQVVAPLAGPAPSRFAVRRGTAEIKQDGVAQIVTPLWLEVAEKAERPRVLLSADGQWASVSPRDNAVLYKDQGALWAASLAAVPRAAFEAARQAALRAAAMSNAKQLGLALLMYAQDYDERLPGPDFSTSLLMPYLKTDRLFEGFTYTYPGGTLSGMDKPAETELGFVTGPGGRAILYGDGHVKWRPD